LELKYGLKKFLIAIGGSSSETSTQDSNQGKSERCF